MNTLLHYTTAFVEGVKPLKDLIPGKAMINYVGSCIKRFIEPYLIRHETCQDAKTQQLLVEKFPLKRIEITQKLMEDQSFLIPDVAKEAFANAIKIGDMALGYINADAVREIPDQSFDKDWMNMFINETQYVSDEKLQQIFARLLKEKICNPDAVNKRVLNIVRNIDAVELETIKMYMSCAIVDFIPTNILYKFDFGIDMMLTLQNIGLVSLNNAPDAIHCFSKTLNLNAEDNILMAKGYDFVFENVEEAIEISFPVYFLTKEGCAIYEMLDIPMREDVMEMYREILSSKCKGKADLRVVKTNSPDNERPLVLAPEA